MEFIYYCKNCQKAFANAPSYEVLCPNCRSQLIPANVSAEKWSAMSDDARNEILRTSVTNYVARANTNMQKEHPFKILTVLLGAIIMSLSLFGGVILIDEGGLIAGITGIIGGFLIICVGQIIQLLNDIKNRL